MTRTTSTHSLTTPRPDDWRLRAACLGKWAVMHPENDEREIAAAKTICAPCPVARECFFDAIATGDMKHGIRAGLRPNERRAVAKELARREAKQQASQPKQPPAVAAVPRPRKSYTSLRDLFNDNTTRLIHGHLAWTGPAKPHFQGRPYNPKQVAFLLDRGHAPVGRVLTTCSVSGCVLPAHVADDVERAQCGTRPGYQRHRKLGEEACGPCRRANTDSDNRLRRTGTTRVAARAAAGADAPHRSRSTGRASSSTGATPRTGRPVNCPAGTAGSRRTSATPG